MKSIFVILILLYLAVVVGCKDANKKTIISNDFEITMLELRGELTKLEFKNHHFFPKTLIFATQKNACQLQRCFANVQSRFSLETIKLMWPIY